MNHDFPDCPSGRGSERTRQVLGSAVLIVTDVGVPGRTGRPTKLTDDVQERILAAARGHQRVEVAAELAGISRETFYNWLRLAAKAKEHLARGGKMTELTALDRRCMDFSEALRQALAQAEGLAVRNVINAGSRASVETKRTRRHVGLDENNQPIYAEEVTTTERPPDWRAEAWWLEHGPTVSGQYAGRQRVELTGAEGGPLAIEFATRMEALKRRIEGGSAAIAAESREVDE